MSIDLHCHTRYSDGSTPLEEVVALASLRGVDTLAITDHDTMAGCAAALQCGAEQGVRIIPGVEISAADVKRGGKAHILCYAPEHPERLQPLLDATTKSRREAMLVSVEKVVRLYPVSREMILRRAEGSTNIYKQHVLQALMDAGATDVYACATHPVLSGPAIERIENSPIKQLVVTDSIQLPEEKQIDKLIQVSVGPLIGDAINRIHENESVSPLFNTRFESAKH